MVVSEVSHDLNSFSSNQPAILVKLRASVRKAKYGGEDDHTQLRHKPLPSTILDHSRNNHKGVPFLEFLFPQSSPLRGDIAHDWEWTCELEEGKRKLQ